MNDILMYKKAYLEIQNVLDRISIIMRIYVNDIPLTINYVVNNYIPFEIQIEDTYQKLIQETKKYLDNEKVYKEY